MSDIISTMVEQMHSSLDFIMKERQYLYGIIVYMMIANNTPVIELPNVDTMSQYGKDYYIFFDHKDNIATVELKERADE